MTVCQYVSLVMDIHVYSCTCTFTFVQIIQEIEEHYFEEGDIDCSQHELEVSTLYMLFV